MRCSPCVERTHPHRPQRRRVQQRAQPGVRGDQFGAHLRGRNIVVGSLIQFRRQHRHPPVTQRQHQALLTAEEPLHIGGPAVQRKCGVGVGGGAVDHVGHEGHPLMQC